MIRAVVDTNVWVSAFMNERGAPAQVFQAFAGGRFIAVVPQAVLDEIVEVLGRDRIRRKTRHTDAEAKEYVQLITERAEVVVTEGRRFGCRDPNDDALLEAAATADALVVVTRDDDLKRDLDLLGRMRETGIAILSVSAFLSLLS